MGYNRGDVGLGGIHLATLGRELLLLAAALVLWSLIAYAVGYWRHSARFIASGRGSAIAFSITIVVASTVLWHALVTGDFQILAVAQETSRTLPLAYKVTAFWSGFSGSLLLWLLVLSVYILYTALRPPRQGRSLVNPAIAVMELVALFYLFVLNVLDNPFAVASGTVYEGAGLNPLLQYPEMMIHPLLLYSGYVGLTVPFAFAIAALLLRRTDLAWLQQTRRTTLVAWLFLSAGIALGAHWSYRVLGWGGYWAWDPVENASFLPWITATAFLHAATVQARRGMMRAWNAILVIVTFLLTILGTFITRSGIVNSVHTFSNEGGVWPYFLGYLAIASAASIALLIWRRASLRDDREPEGVVSKEGSFLLNNVLLLGAAVAILWGTLYPLISQATGGLPVTVGPPFYDAVFGPIAFAVILLMGVCPLVPWRQADLRRLLRGLQIPFGFGVVAAILTLVFTHSYLPAVLVGGLWLTGATLLREFYLGYRARRAGRHENPLRAAVGFLSANRRRYGGYVVHLGILVLAAGLAFSTLQQVQRTVTLSPGQSATIGEYTVTFQGLQEGYPQGLRRVAARLMVTGGSLGRVQLTPQQTFYPQISGPAQPMGLPALRSGPLADVYTVLSGWTGSHATVLLIVEPLVSWIWFGALIVVLGILLSLSEPPESPSTPARKEAVAWSS
ncbi:MAG: heme lyase CcmF/NrfE family subunit [Thermaerobacter sp.]|nr:heme lyase CcmF/NrfE family subunit [Thermaerobacter sp.]